MYLTEELLTQWTGLKGRDLSIFYLTYKKHAPNALLHHDLDYLKQDITKFLNNIWLSVEKDSKQQHTEQHTEQHMEQHTEQHKETKVSSLIKFWESKVKR